jgi:hypothetical protein
MSDIEAPPTLTQTATPDATARMIVTEIRAATPPTDVNAARALLKEQSTREVPIFSSEPSTTSTAPTPVSARQAETASASPREAAASISLDTKENLSAGDVSTIEGQRTFRLRCAELCERLQRKLTGIAESSSWGIVRWAATSASAIAGAVVALVAPKLATSTQTAAWSMPKTEISPSLGHGDSAKKGIIERANSHSDRSDDTTTAGLKRQSTLEAITQGAQALGEARRKEAEERNKKNGEMAERREHETSALEHELEAVDQENHHESPEIGRIKASARGPFGWSRFNLISQIRAINAREDREEAAMATRRKA